MQGLPLPAIACRDRRLLPYIFTFILHWAGKLFSVALSVNPVIHRTTRLLTGALLCAVRTFLSPTLGGRAMAAPVVWQK